MNVAKRLFSALLLVIGFGAINHAQTLNGKQLPYICDVAYQNCRSDVLTLIKNEPVGIDVSFWYMTDARYSNELIKRWNQGLRIRIIVDPRANKSKPANAPILAALASAGIPMIYKSFGDINHMKCMIFAGQGVAQFSGANYSPFEYLTQTPYTDYNADAVYFSNEPDVVHSMMRRFDDIWTNANYPVYANPIQRRRSYPLYAIDPDLNFPPEQDYIQRLIAHIGAETVGLNVIMFRDIDWRPATALIQAVQRGVPVLFISEPKEYRNPLRYLDAYNMDRMYAGAVHIKMRAHAGMMHQKTIIFRGQHLVVHGTSNWAPSGSLEMNYFTTKDWVFDYFVRQFSYKWNNRLVDGTFLPQQTTTFIPLPPDRPKVVSPSYGATGVPRTKTLRWYAGLWAWRYDLYFGTSPNPPLYRSNLALNPSLTPTDYKQWGVTGLAPHTTYYWRVVSKTMAGKTASGSTWRFTTGG